MAHIKLISSLICIFNYIIFTQILSRINSPIYGQPSTSIRPIINHEEIFDTQIWMIQYINKQITDARLYNFLQLDKRKCQ